MGTAEKPNSSFPKCSSSPMFEHSSILTFECLNIQMFQSLNVCPLIRSSTCRAVLAKCVRIQQCIVLYHFISARNIQSEIQPFCVVILARICNVVGTFRPIEECSKMLSRAWYQMGSLDNWTTGPDDDTEE